MAMANLPRTVPSIHGPVRVLREPINGAHGEVEFNERVIRIDPELEPALAWTTLWHEVAHLALWDSGVHNLLKGPVEEAVCDSLGNYLSFAAARFGPARKP